MVKRIGSSRRKTRHVSRQYYKDKGKIPLSRYFQQFQPGDHVALVASPLLTAGRYFRRFHGQTAQIIGQKGRCYQVKLKNGQKQKIFNVHPFHLKKLE